MSTGTSQPGSISDSQLTADEVERLARLHREYVRRINAGELPENIQDDIKSRLENEGNSSAVVWAHAVVKCYIGEDAKYRVMLDWFNDWTAKVEKDQQFGRFSELNKLGAGGFGVVFQAFDKKRLGYVAVKLPHVKLTGSTMRTIDVRESAHHFTTFFDEVRKHAHITVPGCVAIHDTGMPKSLSVDQILVHLRKAPIWFSMQLIRGKSLEDVLNRGYEPGETMPDDQIIELIMLVAERLHGLHSATFSNGDGNLLHRDIKPANILLDQDNVPWLTDFGLALSIKRFGSARSNRDGTPPYMSPEQLKHRGNIDCRSDVFSLGIVLYQMLCGCLPFANESEIKTKDPEHPHEKRKSITPELAQICLKALSKDPIGRYETAQEMANALRNCRWFHQGVAQLINVGRIADAVEFVAFIPRIERTTKTSQSGYLQHELGMILSAIFDAERRKVRANQKGENPINAKKLWNLLSDSYATNDLEQLIGWMGKTQSKKTWQELIGLFLETDDYVVRYAAGCGQAIRFQRLVAQEQIALAIQEIDWLFDRDANEQEVACYAIAGIGKANCVPAEAKSWFQDRLREMSSSKFYFARSALGDMLIHWSVNERREELEDLDEKIAGFWNPIWDYLKLDVIAVASANPLLRNSVVARTNPDLREAIKAHNQLIKDMKTQCLHLLKTFGKSEQLARLIRTHLNEEDQESLAGKGQESENPGDWQSMQSLFCEVRPERDESIRPLEEVTSLFRFLFSHPAWSKGEDIAAILKKVADSSQYRKTVFKVVDHLLAVKKYENWRVHFGALEATFLLRHVDPKRFDKSAFPEMGDVSNLEFGRFEKNISKFYAHDVCLIRGLCAENFVADLLTRSPSEWIGRLTYFMFAIKRWLRDNDCWVLEHMFRLFQKLKAQRDGPAIAELDGWMRKTFSEVQQETDSLLHRVGPRWHELSRHKFLITLEKCRREQIGANTKSTTRP